MRAIAVAAGRLRFTFRAVGSNARVTLLRRRPLSAYYGGKSWQQRVAVPLWKPNIGHAFCFSMQKRKIRHTPPAMLRSGFGKGFRWRKSGTPVSAAGKASQCAAAQCSK